jgi:hypothetical protein
MTEVECASGTQDPCLVVAMDTPSCERLQADGPADALQQVHIQTANDASPRIEAAPVPHDPPV